MSWAYFVSATIASNKVDTLLMDYFILLLLFIYLVKCSFWPIQRRFKVGLSDDTKQLLDQYLRDFGPVVNPAAAASSPETDPDKSPH